MKARLHLALNNDAQVETLFKEAISKAETIGSKIAELGASCDLAQYYISQNQLAAAKKILSPLLLRFSEQQIELDLSHAKSLLETIDDRIEK